MNILQIVLIEQFLFVNPFQVVFVAFGKFGVTVDDNIIKASNFFSLGRQFRSKILLLFFNIDKLQF